MSEGQDIKKIAIYTRVSTEDQAKEGYSLESQLDRLRAYCTARAWEIAGEYIDAGYSGRNTRRPMYNKMMEEISRWDGILVIKMDRIHRNRINFITMMQNLRKKDKQFISMNESLDTSTAMGRFVMGIIQDIAQLESEQIGERVSFGLLQKVKESKEFMGHRTPFGYSWDAKKQRFIPKPEELDLVKSVFQMYLDGFTMRQIGSKTGKANTTVKYFLHNCFYAGLERWCNHFRKIPNLEPVISVDTFNQVQQLLRDRCLSHRKYEPMLVKDDVDSFKIDSQKVKLIPVINRAKHNYNF